MVRPRVGRDARGKIEKPIVALRDEELMSVAGGRIGMLSSAFSSAVKTIGEAVNTMARKE